MTNQKISQPQNSGERLGYHSSAGSSSSADERDGSTGEGVQTCDDQANNQGQK